MSEIINNPTDSVNIFGKNGLTPNEVFDKVLLTRPEFQGGNNIPLFVQKYEGKAKTSIQANQRIFKLPRLENDFVAATAQSSDGTGTRVKNIILVEKDFEAISIGEMVTDPDTGVLAEVIDKQMGRLTVTFVDSPTNGTNVFMAADFQNGSYVSPRGAVTDTNNRKQIHNGYAVPSIDEYPVGMFSEDCHISLAEMRLKTVLTEANGTKYYAYQKQTAAMNALRNKLNIYMLEDHEGVFAGEKSRPQSYVNQIRKFAPNNMVTKSDNMSLLEYEEIISHYVKYGSNQSGMLYGFCDQDYMNNISRVFRGVSDLTGVNSTLGNGAVVGITSKFVEDVCGLKIIWSVDKTYQNKKIFGDSRSNTCIYVDPATVATQDGSVVSPIFSVYNGFDGFKGWNTEGAFNNGKESKNPVTDQFGTTTHMNIEKNYIIANPKSALVVQRAS